jgi:hypothetical protein
VGVESLRPRGTTKEAKHTCPVFGGLSNKKTSCLAEMPWRMLSGSTATVTGLKSRPELNGREATIRSFNEEKGRYNAEVAGEGVMALKPNNLEQSDAQRRSHGRSMFMGSVEEAKDVCAMPDLSTDASGSVAAEAAATTEAICSTIPAAPPAASSSDARRKEVEARVEAARRVQAETEARKECEQLAAQVETALRAQEEADEVAKKRPDAKSTASARKLTEADIFGMDGSESRAHEGNGVDTPEVKDYRMQGNYGATKFIKP